MGHAFTKSQVIKLLTLYHTWSSTRESAKLIYIKCHFIDKQSPECLQNWAPQRSEPPPAPRLLPDQSALIQSIKISIKSLGWSRLQTNDYLTTLTTSIPHNVRVLEFSVGLIKTVTCPNDTINHLLSRNWRKEKSDLFFHFIDVRVTSDQGPCWA